MENAINIQVQRPKLIAIVKPMPRMKECEECGEIVPTHTPIPVVSVREQTQTAGRNFTPFFTPTQPIPPPTEVARMSENFRDLILGDGWSDWFSYNARQQEMAKFIGTKISLISRSNIRYEGILDKINLDALFISLSNVRVIGTEDRVINRPIPPSNRIRNLLSFCLTRIKDVTVLEVPDAPEVQRHHTNAAVFAPLRVRENRSYNLRREYNTSLNQSN
ncbi:unnamed protein product [Orchesella dallaii]|uniref:Lsm14-like N-terminal domain-containing protein n=1 Tax=Orchesella dallaii TaxID=48710 RepID=A0ABP1PQL1_9HEXA